jgi:hypothetical protein
MSNEENLSEVLTDSYQQHQKEVAIQTLGERTHLTIALIAKLLEHPEHGATIGSITLDDLLSVSQKTKTEEGGGSPEITPEPKKAAKKASAEKPAKKTPTKKSTKKAAAEDTEDEETSRGGRQRLDRKQGYEEIKAALKAHGEPASNGDLAKATGFTPVQVRTFLNELVESGKVSYEGKGRGTKYFLTSSK